MLGLTNYVIVIVVNQLANSEKKHTNWFDQVPTVRLAALRSIYTDTTGNQHTRSNIQKQVYPFNQVATVRQAYGLTGTRYGTHTPYRNGVQITLDDVVSRRDEIILIRDGLSVEAALKAAQIHRILPDRRGS